MGYQASEAKYKACTGIDGLEEILEMITKEDLERYDWDHSFIVGYLKPESSQCDKCVYSYYMEGGSVSFGNNTYRQRYCNKRVIAIHEKGLDDCDSLKDKNLK